MGMFCENKKMIGWRNVWSMKWRVPDKNVDQRLVHRLCKRLSGTSGFSGARNSEWQWHQLGICKSASRPRQITTLASHLVFYRSDVLPATQPTVSKDYVLLYILFEFQNCLVAAHHCMDMNETVNKISHCRESTVNSWLCMIIDSHHHHHHHQKIL